MTKIPKSVKLSSSISKNPMSLSVKQSFPSQEVIENIGRLSKVNASPSQFSGMSPHQIAEKIISELSGKISIDLSKATPAERDSIMEAANVEIDGIKPVISVTTPEVNEDLILRAINSEILEDKIGGKPNIGRTAFRRFIQALLEDPKNYPLVRDEWNKFIVDHGETGHVTSPYESHHFQNVGLKRRSEGEDDLREKQIDFVKGVMEEVRGQVATLFENEAILQHSSPEMNEPDARLMALGQAEWSNFVRGAAYYRYRRGENSLDGYAPRRLAANVIDQTTRDITSKIYIVGGEENHQRLNGKATNIFHQHGFKKGGLVVVGGAQYLIVGFRSYRYFEGEHEVEPKMELRAVDISDLKGPEKYIELADALAQNPNGSIPGPIGQRLSRAAFSIRTSIENIFR